MVAAPVEISKCGDPACDQGDPVAANQKNPCDFAEKCAAACAAYGKVCPCAARAAGRAACESLDKLSEKSVLFATKPEITKLNPDDLVIGETLGRGGFSEVHDVVLKTGDEQGQHLAVKYLKRKIMVDRHHFELGAADLAVEANFLAALDHPHIVKVHGLTAGSVETNVASGKECGFFIVVDRLYDTLEKRIETWRKEAEANTGSLLYRMSNEFKSQRRSALQARLQLSLQIADAMQYLHSLNIIYRDLKPDNMGFDKDENLKLFDFGLAKELKKHDKHADGRYAMTGNTGSRRYMAPEVAKESPYNTSADVYSFGILLWELCALEKPFFGYSSGKHMQQVVIGGERPPLDTSAVSWWPAPLQDLMKKCWAPFPVCRPDYATVVQTLKDIVANFDANSSAHPEQMEAAIAPPAEGFGAIKKPGRMRRKTTSEATRSKTGQSGGRRGLASFGLRMPRRGQSTPER